MTKFEQAVNIIANESMTRLSIIKKAQWTHSCENEADFRIVCNGKEKEIELKDGWKGLMYKDKNITFVYFYGENVMYAL